MGKPRKYVSGLHFVAPQDLQQVNSLWRKLLSQGQRGSPLVLICLPKFPVQF